MQADRDCARASAAVPQATPSHADAGGDLQASASEHSEQIESKRRVSSRFIQASLVRAIGEGEYPPGTSLVETALAQRFGVSRIPVREALRGLEQDGLVIHIPNKGRFVAPLSTQDIEEVFFLRETLELAAVQLSYERIPDQRLEELAADLEALSLETSSRQDFFRVDSEVHEVIVTYAGNRRLQSMLQLLNSQIERARSTAAMQPNRLAKSVKEHEDIVLALRLRDLPLIEARLRIHLRHVKESTIDVCRAILRP